VSGVIVHDQVNVEIGWDVAFDLTQEGEKLAAAMAGIATPDDLAGGGVESGEQAEGSVARVVVGAPLDLSRAHGQQRLGPVQRLDLALLVDAQNQGALRRGQIKPDDVAHLVDKQWVGGKLEGLGAMRLKVERPPNAMDGRGRKSDRARHRAQAPMRRIPRRGLQRQANRLGDLVIADPARRAGARLVEEAINPALGEPSPPFANRVGGCVDAQADVPSRILRGINPQSESNIFADHDTRLCGRI
jgi:hypothetical protein